MDKKTILKLIFLFFFFNCKSYAGVITYNFSDKQITYKDLDGNIFKVSKEDLNNLKEFDYYLLKELDVESDLKKNKSDIIYNTNKKIFSPNQATLITIEKNFNNTINLLLLKNKNFKNLIVETKKLKVLTSGNDIQKINYKYYLDRIKRTTPSKWNFIIEENDIILKKYGNEQFKKNDYYIILLTKKPQNFPSKINYRYTVTTYDNRKFEGVLGVRINDSDIFRLGEYYILKKKIKIIRNKNLINIFQNLNINETIIFFAQGATDIYAEVFYDFFEIEDNANYSIQFDDKYLLIPDSFENNDSTNKNIYNISNINQTLILSKNYTADIKTYDELTKKSFTGNSNFNDFVSILSTNKNIKFLFITNIKNFELKSKSKNFFQLGPIFKYGGLTTIYLALIIYLLNRNFKINEQIFNVFYKLGFLTIILLFLSNFIGAILQTSIVGDLILYMCTYLNFFLGYFLFVIFIIICITERKNININ
jgi:hypothetical protein